MPRVPRLRHPRCVLCVVFTSAEKNVGPDPFESRSIMEYATTGVDLQPGEVIVSHAYSASPSRVFAILLTHLRIVIGSRDRSRHPARVRVGSIFEQNGRE